MNLLSRASDIVEAITASTISLLRGTSQQSLPPIRMANKGMLDFQLWVLKPTDEAEKGVSEEMHLSDLRNNEHTKW